MTWRVMIILSGLLAIGLVAAAAHVGAGRNDEPRAAPDLGVPEDLAALSWLAGTWIGGKQGRTGEEYVEEWWSRPVGTSIMGAFRWLNADATPRMFEILTITSESDGVYLRLRHVDAKGVSWEEKDKPLTLRLKESGEHRAVFERIDETTVPAKVVYERRDGVLAIDVIFPPERANPPLEFRLKIQD